MVKSQPYIDGIGENAANNLIPTKEIAHFFKTLRCIVLMTCGWILPKEAAWSEAVIEPASNPIQSPDCTCFYASPLRLIAPLGAIVWGLWLGRVKIQGGTRAFDKMKYDERHGLNSVSITRALDMLIQLWQDRVSCRPKIKRLSPRGILGVLGVRRV